MTYDEMLQAHVRDFDRVSARIRAIMLERNYDNHDSAEMQKLRNELADTVHLAFRMKCCHGHAEGIVTRERNEAMPAL